jgi:nucleotide-binding universal stress UspA family protein
LAASFGSTIIAMHTIPFTIVSDTLGLYPPVTINQRITEDLRSEAILELKKVLETKNAPVGTKIEVTHGDPATEILRCARQLDCSSIVMGSHGRKGLERAILGSVTTSVLARAKLPVFTIAPKP